MILLNILLTVLFLTFLTLGIIHFYWAFGGEWAIKNAIPTKKENENIDFRPGTFITFLVGVFLVAFAFFYLFKSDYFVVELPSWTSYFLWILPSIFLLRAIGDFKYVGFFRSIKTTLFAKWDKKLFSPLCLFLSVLGFVILYLN
ncbi:DUF3995 domain-containing protein [uncultured Polaribacter sp.]|uniref:DUF3995 domain-containing protein n=1 Tax=uncultured Polaribacter sp. TaxID=174711 RepID=UPI0026192FC1|nr:DUF3995 domain-containing protein [uncultured Polaribacter sp.]